MDWDHIEGNWTQFKVDVKRYWDRLTEDQLVEIAGKRDQLAGRIEEAYGITKENTERQISAWQSNQKPKDLRDIQ